MTNLFSIKLPMQFNGEREIFSVNVAEKYWISFWGEMNIGPYLTLYIRSSLKYIKDLNIKTKTIKFLEENIGSFSNLCSLEEGTYFFDRHK